MPTAVVVGGGISGLAAATALGRRGWQVRLLERAPEFTEVGAGISLWPNALRALDVIGVGAAVRSFGGVEFNAGIRHRDGRWLVRMDAEALAREYGEVLILHRAELLAALLEAATATTDVVTSHPVDRVESSVDSAVVDGAPADLVIGADGIHSTVRTAVWPNAPRPRYAGYTAWRFVTPTPVAVTEAGEAWGRGARFGYASLPDGRVYGYATANVPAGQRAPDELAELRTRFADWHEPIPTLLRTATSALRHDLFELPDLRTYVHHRVALVGDAAHAMTPNLGQGACQALEDVATLATLLDRTGDVGLALARYDQLRRRHTQRVVRLSRQAGAMGQWANPLAVGLRDRLLPLLPATMMARSLGPIVAGPATVR